MIGIFAALIVIASVQTADDAVDTTVCDIISNPKAFDGRLVRLRAGVQPAWPHGIYLIDQHCVGRIQLASTQAVPADQARAFDAAVGDEFTGGFDRTAVATFIGRVAWKPISGGQIHYNPFKVTVQQIHQIEVSRKWR